MIIGFCRDDYLLDQNIALQDNIWAFSLETGDVFHGRRWRSYYPISKESPYQVTPPLGYFEKNSVIGVQVDMDRGTVNFYKDDKDLGVAFSMPELKEGKLIPFVHTKQQCELEVFHPSVYPDACEFSEEPVPPPEPIETEYS